MSIKSEIAANLCTAARDMAAKEYPELTLEFIIYRGKDAVHALENNRIEISRHMAGDIILPRLQYEAAKSAPPAFFGMALAKPKGLLHYFTKPQALACFFINLDQIQSASDLSFEVYTLVWRALSLLRDIQNKNESAYKIDDDLIRPVDTPGQKAMNNMMADCFAAFVLQLGGEQDAILKQSRAQSLKTISAVPGYAAENHPFPMALDAALVIYKDLAASQSENGILRGALTMADELRYTHNEKTTQQWKTFSLAAQQMAWLGIERRRLLGTAVHNSEDPYIRSIAYIIAETLNTEPMLSVHFAGYNPFTDQEVNERKHKKALEESLKRLLPESDKIETASRYLTLKIIEHNKVLLAGHPVGWASYAFMRVMDSLDSIKAEENHTDLIPAEIITNLFEKAAGELEWTSICALNEFIMLQRRAGRALTGRKLQELLLQSNVPQSDLIAIAFDIHGNKVIRAEHESRPEIKSLSLSDFEKYKSAEEELADLEKNQDSWTQNAAINPKTGLPLSGLQLDHGDEPSKTDEEESDKETTRDVLEDMTTNLSIDDSDFSEN